MADFHNNPWLAAAIELNEQLQREPKEVQQGQRLLNRKPYPQFLSDKGYLTTVSDDPFYLPDIESDDCPDVINYIPRNSKYAVIIGGSTNEPHFFRQKEEFDEFCREILNDLGTDFQAYEMADGEWKEQDCNPYDLFESIDDTAHPLAHGQLLGRYAGEVDPKILWNIAQGNEQQITLIPCGSKRAQVESTYQRLEVVGAWDMPDIDDELAAVFEDVPALFNTEQPVEEFITDEWLSDVTEGIDWIF